MLNEQMKAIGLLARDIADAALRPNAPDDLGEIYNDLVVASDVLVPPLGYPSDAQHAVLLARVMLDAMRRVEADVHGLYEDEQDERFPSKNEVFATRQPRPYVRPSWRERLLHVTRPVNIVGEGYSELQVAVVSFDRGTIAVALGAGTSRSGWVPTSILSSADARKAAATLMVAADALEALDAEAAA